MAAEASDPAGQQVQHGHFPEVRLLGQRAAQPEDYTDDGKKPREPRVNISTVSEAKQDRRPRAF